MSQTTIRASGQPIAFPGLIADSAEGQDVVSRFSDEATNAILFGIGVVQSTSNDLGIKNPSNAGTDTFVGVNAFGFFHQPGVTGDITQTASPAGLKPHAGAQVMKRGRIWVYIDPSISSIAAGIDRAFLRCVANGGNNIVGAFAKAADGGNTLDLTKLAVFVSGVRTAFDGTKIAMLELSATIKP